MHKKHIPLPQNGEISTTEVALLTFLDSFHSEKPEIKTKDVKRILFEAQQPLIIKRQVSRRGRLCSVQVMHPKHALNIKKVMPHISAHFVMYSTASERKEAALGIVKG